MGVFSNLKPRNSVERNGFDLSRRSVFSTKCGMILPCFCQATLPDSEYKIDLRQLLRTQPLQTAAFTGFTINYDFFFVPNNYSYSSFNEFISQRKDDRHVGQPSFQTVPRFNMKSFLRFVLAGAVYDTILDWHYKSTGYSVIEHPSQTSVPFGFYLISSVNSPWQSTCLEIVRVLDMLGYGNYLPYVKEYATALFNDMSLYGNSKGVDIADSASNFVFILKQYLGELVDVTWADVDFNTPTKIFQALIALMDYISTSENMSCSISDLDASLAPTLWPFLAYNKAFYEFYRNSYYDMKYTLVVNLWDANNPQSSVYKLDFDYVQLFNFDDFNQSYAVANDLINQTAYLLRLAAIMTPKYHLYKKDLFTGVLPSTQFGDVSVMVTDNDYRRLFVTNTTEGFGPLPVNGYPQGANTLLSLSSPSGLTPAMFRFDPALVISVLESRRADAMQRFKERLLRAGNKVKDVFKAHGWNEPYSAQESQPVFIGTFDGRLDINAVAATTETESIELGQLAANGVSVVNGKPLRFKCHDFGYIVGVMYIVKDAEYDAFGLERQHCLVDAFDYPYPELQNISLAPIDVNEVSIYPRLLSPLIADEIIGYLPRFMEFKTGLDKVHGEFFGASHNPIYLGDKTGNYSDYPSGVFSDWVTPRVDINNPTSLSFLYQNPNIADNIFKQWASASQYTDQFLVNCLFDVMAVEPVSVIGLPI